MRNQNHPGAVSVIAATFLAATFFSFSQTANGGNVRPVSTYYPPFVNPAVANSAYQAEQPAPSQANQPNQANQSIQSNEPNDPDYWMHLATIYQQQGRIADSEKVLREFLHRFPQSNKSNLVRARLVELKRIESEQHTRTAVRGEAPNAAQLRASKRWRHANMPLRVYIADGKNVQGYRDAYKKIFVDAFRQWSQCSIGNISFVVTNNPQACDIKCIWADNPLRLVNRTEGGETELKVDQNGGIQNAKITLLTRLPHSGPLTDDQMTQLALHEIGHALGISHSFANADVMFHTARPKMLTRLSAGDRLTLAELYTSSDPEPAGTATVSSSN